MPCVDVNFPLYVLCFCTLLVSLQFWEHWQEGREDGKTCNRGPGARQLAERLSLHLEEEHGLHWKHPFLELTAPRTPFRSSVELIKPCRRGTPSALPTTRQNLPPTTKNSKTPGFCFFGLPSHYYSQEKFAYFRPPFPPKGTPNSQMTAEPKSPYSKLIHWKWGVHYKPHTSTRLLK